MNKVNPPAGSNEIRRRVRDFPQRYGYFVPRERHRLVVDRRAAVLFTVRRIAHDDSRVPGRKMLAYALHGRVNNIANAA